ncbi:MAG: sigma-70 family RNA polymerase sigma factor [Verrucomicrobiaceae bacterium]|nr:sigma-70 family RNA polymerase sigma factor [Verrucomicrobiaceae bacterium]
MIPTHSESRAWMAAWLQHGDESAARALMEACYPFVISLIRRHVADRGADEDLAQQTFTRCFAKAAQWDPGKPLEPWLARIAINLCRDHHRARRVRPELRWSDLPEGEREAMEATLASAEAAPDSLNDDSRALMLRLLDTLGADDRMVLSLLHLEDKTTDEIAALTGWSRALVKVRAFRARGKLRTAFEKLERTKA